MNKIFQLRMISLRLEGFIACNHVMSKIRAAFKVDLSLELFIDSPRIKDLAKAVDAVK